MNITPGYDKAAAYDGSNERIPAGGYICRIMKAWVETTMSGSEQLVLALEIAEGEYAGYFGRQFTSRKETNPNAKWTCVFKQFTLGTDGKTNPFFKGMIKSIEESNAGYRWNWQETELKNKLIGMIFREEEFEAADGTIKTTVRPAFPRSTQRIRNGVETPEIRRLNRNQGNARNVSFDPFQNAQSKSSDYETYDGKLPWE